MKGLVILILVLFASCSQKVVPPSADKGLSAEEISGREIYMRSCDRCHPGGMAGLGPAIINKPLPGFLIKFQVRNGLGVMPSFKKNRISGEELDNLVAYIKSL